MKAQTNLCICAEPLSLYAKSIDVDEGSDQHLNTIFEALPGVLGNRGNRALFQGNREQRPNFEGNRGKRQYWGTGNIRKQIFDFGEQGNKPIYFRGTREQVPPPPPVHKSYDQYINLMYIRTCL